MSNIIKGSLNAMAAQNNVGLAEAFLTADAIILVDTSGSMDARDDREDRRTRYTRACDELTKLQASLAGRIAVISFSTDTVFCPGGLPTNLGMGTNLAKALEFVAVADGVVDRFVVISDGQPDDPEKALAVACKFTTVIDCVYIGPPGDSGEDFLRRLAGAHGGQSVNIKGAALLAEKVEMLMIGAGR